jgi:hypothetical protein
VLWYLQWKRSRWESRNQTLSALRVDTPVKRIVYSTPHLGRQAVSAPTLESAPAAKTTRPVIIPRRRSA